MLSAVSKDDNLKHWRRYFVTGISQESLDETEVNGNFLPTLFTAAMS